MLMPHQTACWHIVYTIWLHCNILKHWIWSHHADITINIDSVLFINSRVLNHKSGVYCINGIELCCWWIRHWDSKWDILCRSRCQDYCHDEVWSEQTAETERPAFWRYRRQWQVNWETGKSIISVLLIGFHCHASSSTTRCIVLLTVQFCSQKAPGCSHVSALLHGKAAFSVYCACVIISLYCGRNTFLWYIGYWQDGCRQ